MELFIEPLDVWLFRDGRPFDALSDHRAESIFPPYPSVVAGAIRSHQLALLGVDFRDRGAIAQAVGTADDLKGLLVRGPVVARRDAAGHLTRYFPFPADAYPDGSGYRELSPGPAPAGVLSSVPTPDLLWPQAGPKKAEPPEWLSEAELTGYLSVPGQVVSGVRSEELFERESRFGIAHSVATRTVREGALFEVEFIRPREGVGLWAEVQGYSGWPKAGTLRIGGEGRGATFSTTCSATAWPAPPAPLPKRLKLYFVTPACFTGGWQPRDWSRFFTGEVSLRAAAVSRYESMGGFDWAADPKSPHAHRPARRHVPAGSVYFFQADQPVSLSAGLVQNAITDFGAEIGFGQVIIKEW